MTTPLSADETLDREFPLIRAKLLEIAATFDRIQRGSGSIADDPRLKEIAQALEILSKPVGAKEDADTARAEAIQLIFSLPYKEEWRDEFQIASTVK